MVYQPAQTFCFFGSINTENKQHETYSKTLILDSRLEQMSNIYP